MEKVAWRDSWWWNAHVNETKTKNVETECQQKDHLSRHCISIGKNTEYHRIHIRKTFNINDEILKQLPCSYLIPENHTIEPKLNPDACILS